MNPLVPLACLLALALAPLPALAGPGPSAAEVQKVLDFYYAEPAGSPILVELKICHEVIGEGEQKNQCAKTISPEAIEIGQTSYLWMNFIVPQSAGTQNILVQFEHDGVTRLTRQITLSPAVRYRTWKKFELDRPGKWSVKVLHDQADGTQPIGSAALLAKPEVLTTAAD